MIEPIAILTLIAISVAFSVAFKALLCLVAVAFMLSLTLFVLKCLDR